MKHPFKPLATALAATLQLAAIAAVPLAWDARPGTPAPASFDRFHGETLEFRCTFRGFGELPFAAGADVRLWYQTNGMGAAWWSAPATIRSNVLSAVWSPEMDPGAERVSLFFGAPSNAYASAVLRLRHSPGFAPGAMPDPIAFHESDPVFSAWLATYTPPDTSLEPATNYTDRATNEVLRSALRADESKRDSLDMGVRGAPTAENGGWFEIGGVVLKYREITSGWFSVRTNLEVFASDNGYGLYLRRPTLLDGSSGLTLLGAFAMLRENGFAASVPCEGRNGTTNICHIVGYTNTIATLEDIPDTSGFATAEYADSAARSAVDPVSNLVETVRTESSLVYRLYSGSNVVAEVTNYNSQVHAPSLRLMQLNESNEYVTVWTETNGLARTLREATNYTDRAIADYAAPRAWSRTTSGLGADAPANTTWISTPTTVIAGGLEYAKVVDAYGEVWVLSSNGMAAEFNPDTNAYFRITADDGTPVFSIEKSDAQLVGANAAGITVGESTITIPVPVVSSVAPTMYWRASLSSGDWADELSPPAGATVTWSGAAGSWVCTVAFTGTRPSSLFFKFNFLQEGGVMIRNNATTDLSSGIWVNGTKFVPSVSGNNLIWTKQ